LWPTNNAVVSGSINVVVDTFGAGCINLLTLVVDGNDWFSLHEGPMVFALPTHYFTNGVHTITARAFCNASMWGETTSRSVKVVFRNLITTEWQDAFGTRLPIRASLMYREADWSIQIKTEGDKIVRTISGITTNGSIDVVWDGKDEASNDVPADAVYFVGITATPRGDSTQVVENAEMSAAPPIKPRSDPPWCKARRGG
jgi:hypothetical protein